jgi:hypothetical protein
MQYTIILGKIIFPAAHTAVIQEIDSIATVEVDTLEAAEEMAEKLAVGFGGDWIIPQFFNGKIIEEDIPEDGICQTCSGSGEGMHEDTTCHACKWRGEY